MANGEDYDEYQEVFTRRRFACLLASPAFAQDKPATAPQTDAPQAADEPALAEIIVTALRREESTSRVPISITVVGDETRPTAVPGALWFDRRARTAYAATRQMQTTPTALVERQSADLSGRKADE